jgi:hypothetical protein
MYRARPKLFNQPIRWRPECTTLAEASAGSGTYMQAQYRRKLSMAIRALEFSNAHPDTDPSYTGVVSRLEEAVTGARALEVQESSGHTREGAAHARRKLLRRAITTQLIHLVRVGAAAARTRPDLVREFPPAKPSRTNRAFLAAARSMLARANAEKDLLVANGLGTNFLDTFGKALDQFDADTETSHIGRSEHVVAGSDLVAVIGECMMEVGILDGLNRARFASDSDLLAGWMSARNVAGPFRRRPPDPNKAAS